MNYTRPQHRFYWKYQPSLVKGNLTVSTVTAALRLNAAAKLRFKKIKVGDTLGIKQEGKLKEMTVIEKYTRVIILQSANYKVAINLNDLLTEGII